MEFLEIPLYDDIVKLLDRFGIDVFFLSIVVLLAIYPNQRERSFTFTAAMLNVTVFFTCFTLKKLEIDIGMELGVSPTHDEMLLNRIPTIAFGFGFARIVPQKIEIFRSRFTRSHIAR